MTNNTYKALYRQYRPKNFIEIKGQEHIVQTLKNIILSNKVSHAYLFSGPRGTGKTSIAKIFSSTLNCSHRDLNSIQACEQCSKNVDNNLDIIEIDAASNTGIDDIRNLKENIKNLPTNSKYKIYIIDEVHMLSKSAWNALLKTIEEPPLHVIFILATTDPQKIPLTVLSRVQRFNFKKIENKFIIEQLKYVYEKENIEFEEDAIKLLSKLSNGLMRDALTMADQVSIFSDSKKVTKKDVEMIFGLTSNETIIKLLNFVFYKSLNETLKYNENIFDNGIDTELLIVHILDILKDLIIYKQTKDFTLLINLQPSEIEKLDLDITNSYLILEHFIKLLKDVKYSDTPKQQFEISLIKLYSEIHKDVVEDANDNKNIINHVNNTKTQPQQQTEIPKNDNLNDFLEFEDNKQNIKNIATNNSIEDNWTGLEENISLNELNSQLKNEHINSIPLVEENLNNINNLNIPVVDQQVEHNQIKQINSSNSYAKNINKFLPIDDLANDTIINEQQTNQKINSILYNTQEFVTIQNDLTSEQEIVQDSILNQEESDDVITVSDIFDEQNDYDEKSHFLESIQEPKEIEIDDIINMMLISQKEKHEVNNTNWSVIYKSNILKSLDTDNNPAYDNYKKLFSNIKLVLSSEKFIIFLADYQSIINTYLQYLEEFEFYEYIKSVFSKEICIFVVNRNKLEKASQYWRENRNEISQRKITPVSCNINKKINDNKQNNLKKSQEIFGDMLKIKK
ncbi:DNA polymerase III subunit gamma/tau [Mycoplasma miroungirhinis]|uniref:DNA polymerase III subunit gamma/tau n=1 Tax=Mycoplasma miroungirhinis TaxID=754516 RepID=A0A6M4JAS6_9MOLU|nr:DNA polymerase III subunit gamma/tau [Mycoplasma miroungirhinis]QJR44073.1 DNA polymerase III subunit gamma/tau [Mycoplasma miroungirhinis]